MYREGKKHQNADSLSRRPCLNCSHCENVEIKDGSASQSASKNPRCDVLQGSKKDGHKEESSWIVGISTREPRKAQREDKDIGYTISCLEKSGERPKRHEISMENTAFKAVWSQWDRLELRG